ncbi:helix-turn-helix transcriptional regulator [Macrococcus armenti]|uniref:helix-turn-helix transcriptional regulator n=1 Tax=Macrococcus armenti TaxID=2875764 RepID=UPI001CCA8D53|nr:helix-turn-helix transcriptional regulator [Macrococcus armenti]UBH12453.1 helix-turn-helix domain-containing protein [Macrococcus armenti]
MVKPPNIKLKTLMIERGIKQKELADVLGITQSLFSQKLNKNKSRFSVEEVILICDHLKINMHEYFFDNDVLKMRRKEGV